MPRRDGTMREVNEAIRLWEQGATYAEMSRRLGRPACTLAYWLNARGYRRSTPHDQFRRSKRKLKRLAREGKTPRQIADALGVRIQLAHIWAKRAGIELTRESREARSKRCRQYISDYWRRSRYEATLTPVDRREIRRKQAAAEAGWPEADHPTEARILQALFDHPEGLTYLELGGIVQRRWSHLRSHIVGPLVALGYVIKQRDSSRRRFVLLRLSPRLRQSRSLE
jgi:hypothetical protein